MVFHPQHRHWHLEAFASYELRRVTDGSVVAASTKVSFCIIDVHRSSEVFAGSPASPYYTRCDRATTNGLSVGWSDEYQSTLPDQYIVITGVADGDYCLVSTADPLARIAQRDLRADAAGVAITITGTAVTQGIPPAPCGP